MLPKKHRLTESKDFTATLREGCRASNRFLSVTIAVPDEGTAISHPQKPLPPARLGLIVAKKEVPTAVSRNRLKRAVRHQLRDRLPEGTDTVVRIFHDAESLTGPQIGMQLAALLARAQQKCSTKSEARHE